MTERARVLVVDAANVIGSRPDGWWRDRVGAAERLLVSLAAARSGPEPDLAARRVLVVLEGRANAAAPDGVAGLELVRAPHDGDGAVVEVVRSHPGDDVLVVTSDQGLRLRVAELGASVRGAGWLRGVLDAAQP